MAAVKAGVSAYRDSAYYNKKYKPMRMAFVPEGALPLLNPKLVSIPGLTMRQRRILRLAEPVLQEVISAMKLKEPPPLFLAVSEAIPNCSATIHPGFIDQLIIQTGVIIDRDVSR